MSTTRAQNVWETSGGSDFLQMINEGGSAMGGIDANANPFGNLAPFKKAHIGVTSSQILSLATTPITLVPPTGANSFANVIVVTAQYNFVTTPYTIVGVGEVDFTIGPAPASAPFYFTLPTVGFVDQSASYIAQGVSTLNPIKVSDFVNQPIVLGLTGGGSLTLGNGNLILEVYYSIESTQ
jgi:hypothetical protein